VVLDLRELELQQAGVVIGKRGLKALLTPADA